MMNLLIADWLRLRRRKDVWLALAAPLLFTSAAYSLGLTSAIGSLDRGLPVEGALNLSDRLVPFTFPVSVPSALQNGQLVTIALLAYVTSATISAEFSLGTVKTSLLMRHARQSFVFVRLGLIGALGLIMLVGLAFLGALLPVIPLALGVDLPQGSTVSSHSVLNALGTLGLLALLVTTIAGLETLLTKSAGLPLILIALQLAAESAVGAVRDQLPQPLATVTALLPFGSAQLLIDRALVAMVPLPSAGDVAEGPPTPILLAAALAWIVALAVLAGRTLRRADIDA